MVLPLIDRGVHNLVFIHYLRFGCIQQAFQSFCFLGQVIGNFDLSNWIHQISTVVILLVNLAIFIYILLLRLLLVVLGSFHVLIIDRSLARCRTCSRPSSLFRPNTTARNHTVLLEFLLRVTAIVPC